MTISIELGPDEERALAERARVSGRDLAGYVHLVLREHIEVPGPAGGPGRRTGSHAPALADLIDDEAIAACGPEADDNISLQEVRVGTSSIKDSMARVVIEDERAERS